MTDESILPLQRLDANQVPPVKVEAQNAKCNGRIASPGPHRKRINPFSDRNTVNRPTNNNNRNDVQNDVVNDSSRRRARSRPNRYDDAPIRDEDKRRTRTERSMKRLRSRERSPVVAKERRDSSRDRKRSGRSDEKHSSRRNHVKDDDDVLRNERSKRARRHATDRRSAEELTHKNADRCDIKLEPNEVKRKKSSKRKSNEQSTSASNDNDALKQKMPRKCEEIETAFASENRSVKLEVRDEPIQQSSVGEVEVVDPEVSDDRKFNAADNLNVASLADNYDKMNDGNAGTESAEILPREIKVDPKTETITAIPLIENQSQESTVSGVEQTDTVGTEDAMEIDTVQTARSDEQVPADVSGDPLAPVEQTIPSLSAGEKNYNAEHEQTITETSIAMKARSTNEPEENDKSQTAPVHEIARINIIPAPTQQTENSENAQIIVQGGHENANETSAASVETERNSSNTSVSKSIKNVSTTSTDYQIVDEENEEIVIYVTRKKVKKPKKEKHENKQKEKHKNKEKEAKEPTTAKI